MKYISIYLCIYGKGKGYQKGKNDQESENRLVTLINEGKLPSEVTKYIILQKIFRFIQSSNK